MSDPREHIHSDIRRLGIRLARRVLRRGHVKLPYAASGDADRSTD